MLPKEARVGLEDDHFVFSTPEGIPFIPGFWSRSALLEMLGDVLASLELT